MPHALDSIANLVPAAACSQRLVVSRPFCVSGSLFYYATHAAHLRSCLVVIYQQDYQSAYDGVWHTLVRVRLSRPVHHDKHSVTRIDWRYFVVILKKASAAYAERPEELTAGKMCASCKESGVCEYMLDGGREEKEGAVGRAFVEANRKHLFNTRSGYC